MPFPKFKKVKVKSVTPLPNLITVYDIVEPVHKLFITNRILTKDTQNFALLYQESAKSQSIKQNIPLEEAEANVEKFRSTIPRVMSLIERQRNYAEIHGFIWNKFQRKMPIPDIHSDNKGIRAHGARQSFNFLIQSSASDCVLAGLVAFVEDLKKRGMKSQLIGAVHDSVEFDIYPGEAIQFYNLIKYHFEAELSERFPWIVCPMRIDIDMGVSWGSCIEMENPILTPDCIKFTGSGYKNDILALADQARKAYNFDYRVLSVKELKESDFIVTDLVRDTEKWEIRAIISNK